jgi:hypothetical protein
MKWLGLGFLGLVGLAFTPTWPLPQLPVVGDGPLFDSSFTAFKGMKGEIFWGAPTNQPFKELWIYSVVPQDFSGEQVSNLMALGSFNLRYEKKWHRNILTTNTEPLLFVNSSNTCDLLIVPAQGWIKYHDQFAPANRWDKTNHLHEAVQGLPDEQGAEKLGLQFLNQFGIERGDLAQKPDGHLVTFGTEEKRSYFDRATGKYIDDEVLERGIYFNRRVDGINFAGIGLGGGCEIVYGNHAKIAELRLLWRNLKPAERHEVASPNQMVQWIRQGKAVLTHKNLVNPSEVKKLTITDMSPLYMGASGEETQNLVFPFAQLEATADLGYTNVPIQLYCPILSMDAEPFVR